MRCPPTRTDGADGRRAGRRCRRPNAGRAAAVAARAHAPHDDDGGDGAALHCCGRRRRRLLGPSCTDDGCSARICRVRQRLPRRRQQRLRPHRDRADWRPRSVRLAGRRGRLQRRPSAVATDRRTAPAGVCRRRWAIAADGGALSRCWRSPGCRRRRCCGGDCCGCCAASGRRDGKWATWVVDRLAGGKWDGISIQYVCYTFCVQLFVQNHVTQVVISCVSHTNRIGRKGGG